MPGEASKAEVGDGSQRMVSSKHTPIPSPTREGELEQDIGPRIEEATVHFARTPELLYGSFLGVSLSVRGTEQFLHMLSQGCNPLDGVSFKRKISPSYNAE